MPAMPRVMKDKATKIAFSILGTPCNIAQKKSSRQKEIDYRLLHENTQRVR